jgi:flagellar biosynthesis/type III secretory pathway protein FliH
MIQSAPAGTAGPFAEYARGYNEGLAVGVRNGRLQMQAELTSELLQILQQFASRPQTVEEAEANLHTAIAKAEGGNDE